MKNLEYKGYTGSIEYSKEDDLPMCLILFLFPNILYLLMTIY